MSNIWSYHILCLSYRYLGAQIAQLQSDGQGDPMAIISPNLAAMISLTQQATDQVKGVPVEAIADASDDGPSLSDSLDLVKSILDLVSAVIVSPRASLLFFSRAYTIFFLGSCG